MKWQHLQALIWLRWRLRSNQRRRASRAALMIQSLVTVLGGLAAVLGFAIGLLLGLYPLRNASAEAVLYAWDAAVAGFFMFWITELLVELQRSELLSLERLLHLPVSLSGAFVINYLSSLITPSIIFFLPAMAGLAFGMSASRGAHMLLLFPLVACLFLMVTAVTHQFRGWLASLMENKRRRRTVIAVATMAFMLVFQIPNLLNFTGVWNFRPQRAMRQETRQLERALKSGEISQEEYQGRIKAIQGQRQAQEEDTENAVRLANMVVPLGWLPYGAMAATEGRVLPALLGTLGLVLAGVASLSRSYRTTLRLYTGQFHSSAPRRVTPQTRPNVENAPLDTKKMRAHAALLEKRLPWISEQASAVALSCFRSLTRAPEAKTMLLSPIVLVLIFGSIFARNDSNPSEFLRPVMASGAITMILFTLIGIAGNQFGFDRSGFRTFILTSASRKDILLGKNLALFPMAVALGTIPIVVLQIVYPMRIDHFIAALAQNVSMYLVFCIVANFLSILAPMAIAPGSLKPAKPKGMTILIHLAFFLILPLALSTMLFPLGVEFILSWSGRFTYFPAYLLLTLLGLVGVAFVYPVFLDIQARMLQDRELRILEIVTAKVE